MIGFVASVGLGCADVAEFLVADVIAAGVTASAVALGFTFLEAVADRICKIDADGIVRAFLVSLAIDDDAVTAGRVGVANHAGRAIIGRIAFVAERGVAAQ